MPHHFEHIAPLERLCVQHISAAKEFVLVRDHVRSVCNLCVLEVHRLTDTQLMEYLHRHVHAGCCVTVEWIIEYYAERLRQGDFPESQMLDMRISALIWRLRMNELGKGLNSRPYFTLQLVS